MIPAIIYIVMSAIAATIFAVITLIFAILHFWAIVALFLIVMAWSEYDKRQRKKI